MLFSSGCYIVNLSYYTLKNVNSKDLKSCFFFSFLFRPRFGKVLELTNEKFLDEIDNENKNVTIIIHIYDTVSGNMMT